MPTNHGSAAQSCSATDHASSTYSKNGSTGTQGFHGSMSTAGPDAALSNPAVTAKSASSGSPPRRHPTLSAPTSAAALKKAAPTRRPVSPNNPSNGAKSQNIRGPGWNHPNRDCTPTSGV